MTTMTDFERGVDGWDIPHLPAKTLGLSEPSNDTQLQFSIDE
jgi:hypothetical protein